MQTPSNSAALSLIYISEEAVRDGFKEDVRMEEARKDYSRKSRETRWGGGFTVVTIANKARRGEEPKWVSWQIGRAHV